MENRRRNGDFIIWTVESPRTITLHPKQRTYGIYLYYETQP